MRLKDLWDLILKHKLIILRIIVLVSIPLVYFFVYATGGIKYVYSHTMYIPILLAGFLLPIPYGLLAGLFGGILLGPFMPIDVATGESQEFLNWFYRLLIFMVIGGLSDYFSYQYSTHMKRIRVLSSTNRETKVPNLHHLSEIKEDGTIYSVFSVLISDHNYIKELFGVEIYNAVVYRTYENLKEILDDRSHVVQSDSNTLWVMVPYTDTRKDTERVSDALKGPMVIRDVKIFVEHYIGASSPSNIKECKTFYPFRESDQLAHHANEHKLPYAIHDESILRKQFQFNILSHFEKALENDELFMSYQPILETKSLEIKKFEALIRWKNPTDGVIMPGDFIPLVENTQLVHNLFEYVLKKSIAKIKEFNEMGKDDCNISINLSGKNFNHNLLDTVDFILNENCKECAKRITLEITETVLMDNPKESSKIIRELKKRGFSIAIDDFGRGYSSFTYLSRFNVDYLKIDGYFINHIEEESVFNIVKASINLAHQLGFKVIAEWVENEKSCSILEEIGCDFVQGFYFSKPIHQDKVVEYYKKYKKQLNEKNK